jgi:hypothetical protein
VNPDIPLVAASPEYVGEPTRHVVPLEHEDALAAVLGEKGGCSESADPRSDHEGIEAVRGRVLSKTLADADHELSL